MSKREFQKIWIEQCEAARNIRVHHGLKASFDCIVAEKLLMFAETAASRAEFARELPQFVARVKGLFTPEELKIHLARIERERMVGETLTAEIGKEDDPFREAPEADAKRAQQFSTIKELLTAAQIGTS